MSTTALYGRTITVTLTHDEARALVRGEQVLVPVSGVPDPDNIRVVVEGHWEAHKADPSKMYSEQYHRDATSAEMTAAFEAIAAVLVYHFRPKTAIDLGCSAGTLTLALRKLGVQAVGVDGSAEAQKVNPTIVVHDLRVREPVPWMPETFDLVTSFDVAEHLESQYADVICELAAGAARPGGWVVFGAATPGQGGLGHVNLQTHDWWTSRLEACGLIYDHERTFELRKRIQENPVTDAAWWVARNLLCLRKP